MVFPTNRQSVTVLLPVFLRGDSNGDGGLDVSDPIQKLNYLFGSGIVGCESALDFNDDGLINLADVVGSLAFVFEGLNSPVAPFPNCGSDSTADSLSCSSHVG